MFYLVRKKMERDGEGVAEEFAWPTVARHAILLSQALLYSGMRDKRYVMTVDDDYDPAPVGDLTNIGYSSNPWYTPVVMRTGLVCRIESLAFLNTTLEIYEKVNPPTRDYGDDEFRDVIPYLTVMVTIGPWRTWGARGPKGPPG